MTCVQYMSCMGSFVLFKRIRYRGCNVLHIRVFFFYLLFKNIYHYALLFINYLIRWNLTGLNLLLKILKIGRKQPIQSNEP